MTKTGNFLSYQAFSIFFISIFVPVVAAFGSGICWDEPFYILAGRRYAEWFFNLNSTSFNYQNISDFWKIGHEHPPLAKFGFGMFNILMNDLTGVVISARLFNVILAGIFHVSLFFLVKKIINVPVSWLTVLILLSLEKYVSYSTVATLDFPVTVFWTLSVCAFYLANRKWYLIFSAGMFSAANLTKFNAVFAVAPLLLWGFFFDLRYVFKRLLFISFIAILSLFMFWPWFYHNTLARAWGYLKNKTGRIEVLNQINMDYKKDNFVDKMPSKVPVHYLGKTYQPEINCPPLHYAFVIFHSTIPISILVLFYIGLARILRNFKKDDFGVLCLLNAFVSVAVFTLPTLPKYGGARFLLNAYPFVAIVAAKALYQLYIKLNAYRKIMNFVCAILFSSLFINTILHINFLNAYYNFLIPSNCSMPIDNAGILLKINDIKLVNSRLPNDAKLCIKGTGQFVLDLYSALNYFRNDISLIQDIAAANCIIIIPNRAYWDAKIKAIYEENDQEWIRLQTSNDLCRIFFRKSS